MNILPLTLLLGALISSDEASLVSNLLTLKGNVSITHPAGHFQADKVVVEKAVGEENKLSHALFEEGVKISLSENRQVECDLADVDFTRLEAILKAEGDHFVTVADPKGDLCLKAKTMHCKFMGEEKQLESLAGESLVELTVGNLYHILASHVEYSRKHHMIAFSEGAVLEHRELGSITAPGLVELFLDEAERISKFVIEGPVDFQKEDLHMTAEKLVIDVDQTTGKSAVKGEGLVTISFPAKPNWKKDFVKKTPA